MTLAVLWFRRDLRLDDLPALIARARADGVVPLFVVDPFLLDPAGPNRRRFLADALRALDRELGGTLVLRHGDPRQVVPQVAAAVGASIVAATADFGPYGAGRDRAVAKALTSAGHDLRAVDSPYAVAPGAVRAKSGAPLRSSRPSGEPGKTWAGSWRPQRRTCFGGVQRRESGRHRGGRGGGRQGYLPPWWEGLPLEAAVRLPPAGSAEAACLLEQFAAGPLRRTPRTATVPPSQAPPAFPPTSDLGASTPALCSGGWERSQAPTECAVSWRGESSTPMSCGITPSRHVDLSRPLATTCAGKLGSTLGTVPGLGHRPDRLPARRCGYAPVPSRRVDAQPCANGGGQLPREGLAHRLAFGARWFMWHLVDADLASNQHNWQWVAGTGTDAAPFHRVFNPRVQQERFDPDGGYVRRYLREKM